MRLLLCHFPVTLTLGAATAQTTECVDAAASPGGSEASWTSASANRDDARAAGAPSAPLWVARGGDLGAANPFVVPNGVTLLGGFERGATRVDLRRPSAQLSILDGGALSRVLRSGSQGAVVRGFALGDARASGSVGLESSGARVDDSSPVLRNRSVTEHATIAGRGAARAVRSGGSPLVENREFTRGTTWFDPTRSPRRIAVGRFPLKTTLQLPRSLPSGFEPVHQSRVFDAPPTRGDGFNAIHTELNSPTRRALDAGASTTQRAQRTDAQPRRLRTPRRHSPT